MGLCNYLKALIQDAVWRGQSLAALPATVHVALIGGSAFPNDGKILRSATYTPGQYAWPSTPNGRLYRCTTGGVTGTTEPNWLDGSAVVNGGTVTDGTVVWTEQSAALAAGTIPEPSGNAYARVPFTRSLSAVMGTQVSASGTASSGPGGTVSPLAAVAFPVGTPGGWGPIWGYALNTAASAGVWLAFTQMDVPRKHEPGDQLNFPGGVENSSYGGIRLTLE